MGGAFSDSLGAGGGPQVGARTGGVLDNSQGEEVPGPTWEALHLLRSRLPLPRARRIPGAKLESHLAPGFWILNKTGIRRPLKM
jgi:hypothetical protein